MSSSDEGESSIPLLAACVMFGVGCALLNIHGWQFLFLLLLALGCVGVYRIVERFEINNKEKP